MQVWINGESIDAKSDWKVGHLRAAARGNRRGYARLHFGGKELTNDNEFLADAGIGAQAYISESDFVPIPDNLSEFKTLYGEELDEAFAVVDQSEIEGNLCCQVVSNMYWSIYITKRVHGSIKYALYKEHYGFFRGTDLAIGDMLSCTEIAASNFHKDIE